MLQLFPLFTLGIGNQSSVTCSYASKLFKFARISAQNYHLALEHGAVGGLPDYHHSRHFKAAVTFEAEPNAVAHLVEVRVAATEDEHAVDENARAETVTVAGQLGDPLPRVRG